MKIARPEKYDIVSVFTKAQSGLIFGQVWQGDTVSAKRELDRIFGKGGLKFGLVEQENGRISQEKEEKCLSITLVKVHGVVFHIFLNSDATPNVASPRLVKQLAIKLERTKKVVTVSSAGESNVLGKVMNVPVLSAQLEARIDLIVLQNVPFDLMIGRPTLKQLGGVLDFRAEEVCLNYHGLGAGIPMVSEYILPRELTAGMDSEDFTSDSDAQQSSTDLNVDQEWMLMLSRQEGSGLSE